MKAGEYLQYNDAALREKCNTLNNGNTHKERDLEVIELLLEARRRKISLDHLYIYETEREWTEQNETVR